MATSHEDDTSYASYQDSAGSVTEAVKSSRTWNSVSYSLRLLAWCFATWPFVTLSSITTACISVFGVLFFPLDFDGILKITWFDPLLILLSYVAFWFLLLTIHRARKGSILDLKAMAKDQSETLVRFLGVLLLQWGLIVHYAAIAFDDMLGHVVPTSQFSVYMPADYAKREQYDLENQRKHPLTMESMAWFASNGLSCILVAFHAVFLLLMYELATALLKKARITESDDGQGVIQRFRRSIWTQTAFAIMTGLTALIIFMPASKVHFFYMFNTHRQRVESLQSILEWYMALVAITATILCFIAYRYSTSPREQAVAFLSHKWSSERPRSRFKPRVPPAANTGDQSMTSFETSSEISRPPLGGSDYAIDMSTKVSTAAAVVRAVAQAELDPPTPAAAPANQQDEAKANLQVHDAVLSIHQQLAKRYHVPTWIDEQKLVGNGNSGSRFTLHRCL
jgi:hypothetical protein